MALKQGKFIGKVNSLFQEFHYVNPEMMMRLIEIYASNFYRSSLWDLLSCDAEELFKSWNVTIRNAFLLDRTTNRCLIEPLLNHLHLKVMLLSRFLKFHKEFINSPKFSVRYLAMLFTQDMRTTTAKTLSFLEEQCHVRKGS